MKIKHTPGPWTYSEYRKGGFHRIRINAKDGDLEYSVGAAAVKFISRNEALANARLISAAPELLEACEEMVAIRCNDCNAIGLAQRFSNISCSNSCPFYKGRAAIAKAKGESCPPTP